MAFMEPFNGFDAAAFEAFEPRKWSSNLFNMERMRVRDALRSLGTALEPALTATRPFAWEVTPYAPSVFNGKRVAEMVLYFTRTAEQARAITPLLDSRIALPDQISNAGEHHHHVTLGVRIDAEGVETGLMVHSTAWLDVMNLLNRARSAEGAQDLVHLVRRLPEGTCFRVAPGRDIPCAEFLPEHVRVLEDSVLNEQFLVRVGTAFDASDDRVAAAGFTPYARGLLTALVPLWEFAAWRPASNYLATEKASKDAPTVTSDGSLVRFGAGAKVRLVGGLFDGRVGVVTDLDAKGACRVLVGRVTVRTEIRSLQAV